MPNPVKLATANIHIRNAFREYFDFLGADEVTDTERAEFLAHVAHTIGYNLLNQGVTERVHDAYVRQLNTKG